MFLLMVVVAVKVQQRAGGIASESALSVVDL